MPLLVVKVFLCLIASLLPHALILHHLLLPLHMSSKHF